MNKLFFRILAGFFCAILLASGCTYIVFSNWSIHPEVFADHLLTTPEIYANLEEVAPEKFIDRLYFFRESECVAALSRGARLPSTVNDDNFVPAFRFRDDTFIITYKWVNFSRGLAISNKTDFIASMQQLDRGLTTWHLKDNVYAWDLELDSSKHNR